MPAAARNSASSAWAGSARASPIMRSSKACASSARAASGAPRELVAAGLTEIAGVSGFRAQLRPPRAVLLYIPAGPAVDAMLDELAKALEPGDVIADGGNSYWGDSMRRHARLRELGIQFVDVGTSGGLAGARHGACFMAGGDRPAVALLEPILRSLPSKAVTFTPALRLRTLREARAQRHRIRNDASHRRRLRALTRHHEPLDIAAVLEAWRHGSVIRSWLVDLLASAYKSDPVRAAVLVDRGHRRSELARRRRAADGGAGAGHRAIGHAAFRLARPAQELGARHRHDAPRLRRPPAGPEGKHRAGAPRGPRGRDLRPGEKGAYG